MAALSTPKSTFGVSGFPRLLSAITAVGAAWGLLLLIVPWSVGTLVGAEAIRLHSAGILFDYTGVSLAGYRTLAWAPIVVGLSFSLLALRAAPRPFEYALGVIGATYAASFLLFGALLGIGPGNAILVGAEIKWVWRIVATALGLAAGLAVPQLIKARAEDMQVDFRGVKRGVLVGGLLFGIVLALLLPGGWLGKTTAGFGSWGGSLVWVLAL
jgi:hypothetical protein